MMKLHTRIALFAGLVFLLAAPPARAININTTSDTFVISNEAPGYLITKLIAAGHGGDSPYQALVFLASMPGGNAAIPPAFLSFLASAPPSATIFTATLSQYSAATGIAISDNGTIHVVSISGSPYNGQSGTTTVDTGTAAVQNVRMVYVNGYVWSYGTPLTQWVETVTMITTAYKVFSIAWALADAAATPVPASLWLAMAGCLAVLGYALWTRRRAVVLFFVLLAAAALPGRAQTSGILIAEGPGKLVDALIAAGYGNLSLYQAVMALQEDSDPSLEDLGAIKETFLDTLATCPANSPVFTTTMTSYAGTGVAIYADCTVAASSLPGSGFDGLAGSTTTATVISGAASAAAVTFSPAYAVDSTHSLFTVLYAPGNTPTATPVPPTLWLAMAGCLAVLGYALWARRMRWLLRNRSAAISDGG